MKDGNLDTSQALALLSNMLDLTKKQWADLEEVGDNFYKQLLRNTKNQIMVIANTAGDSTANDLFIDALNAYDRELYSEFPDAEDLINLTLDCTELFRLAHGKTSQRKVTFLENALEKILKGLSFQRKPQYIIYDPYTTKKKTSNIITYEDG